MNRGNGTRKSARKRRTSAAFDEYDLDEDYVEADPPKRPRRLVQLTSRGDVFDLCQSILSQLINHKFGWVFKDPVDPVALDIPDYFEKIKNPMDLGTIQKKLNDFEYDDIEEFAADVRLVFSNCLTYNPPGADVHLMGITLSGIFEKQWKNFRGKPTKKASTPKNGKTDEISEMQSVILDLKNEHQKLLNELSKLVKGTQQHAERSNQVNVAKPKKKKAPKKEKVKVKVEVETFTVKQKRDLSINIHKLSPEELQGMVQLLSTTINDTQKQNGELEIDLDSLSIPTLKILNQYVNDCIKKKTGIADNLKIMENSGKSDESSSSSDSDSSSESDSESEPEKLTTGKENETSA